MSAAAARGPWGTLWHSDTTATPTCRTAVERHFQPWLRREKLSDILTSVSDTNAEG